MILSGIKRGTAAVLIFGAALLAGCSYYTALPKNLPLIKEYEGVSLTGVSLIVTNGERDSAEHDILTDEGEKSGFRSNRQAWSKKLVEALARELARRGAQVRSDAPVTLDITLPEVTFVQTKALYQFHVKVTVSLSTGWSKTYEGVAGLNRYNVWSASAEADRLAGQALAEAAKAMLGDAEFLAHLGGGAPAGETASPTMMTR